MRALLFVLLASCATAESGPLSEGMGGACATDADCHTQANYCKSCECASLAKNQTLPKCDGPSVNCLIDPCKNKTAACVDSKCTTKSR